MDKINIPKKSVLRWLTGLILGCVFIYLAVKDIPLSDVVISFQHAKIEWIFLALIAVTLNNLAKVWRWQVLLAERRLRVPFWLGLRSILFGQMLNFLLPARTGDLSRAYLVGIHGTGTVFALGTIVLEKAFDTLLYGLLFLITALLFPLPVWLNKSGTTLLIIVCLLICLIFFFTHYSDKFFLVGMKFVKILPTSFQRGIEPRLADALETLEIVKNGKGLVSLIVWSFFIWITAVFHNWAILKALNLPGNWLSAMTVLIVLQAVITLPGIPGRIGIFQYACILALGLFGISEIDAFSYGVLLQVVVVLPIILGGIISLGNLKWRKPENN